MKGQRIQNKRVLSQYMIRYGVVVLVTAFFMLVLMNWILGQHKQELVLEVKEELLDSLQELEACLAGQQTLAREIYLNRLSKPQHMLYSSLAAREGIDQIGLYRDSLEVNDYVLAKYQAEVFFTQEGEIVWENLIKTMLKLDEASSSVFEETMNDHGEVAVRVLTDVDGRKLLLFAYPMLTELAEGNDMIGFIIRGESLGKYLEKELRQENLYALMLGKDGELLFEINSLEGVNSDKTSQLRSQLILEEGASLKDYTCGSYPLAGGFVFYYALQNDTLFVNFNKMIVQSVLFGVLIFVVAFGMINAVNHANVRRITNVRDELLHYNSGIPMMQDKDELRQIQHLIRRMYQEQKQINVVKEQIVRILCSGLIAQEEILIEIVQNVSPGLCSAYYVVLSVVAAEQSEKLIKVLTREEPFKMYIVEHYQDTTVLSFVIGLPDKDEQGKRRRNLAQRLLAEAHRHGIVNLFVMAGRAYNKLCEISCSYQGMLSMMYYQLSNMQADSESVFVYEEVIQQKQTRYLTREDILRLEKTLLDGSMEETTKVINNLLKRIEESGNTITQCFGRGVFAESLYGLLREQGIDPGRIDRILGLPVENKEAFEAGVFSVLKKCCAETVVPIETIMNYIDAHYKDASLGLEALAIHFNMSVSGVSRYIKEQNGQKYSEYISELRLNEACRLLAETDMKIQDIPYEIGYKDYVSFSKKFKGAKGLSPSAYRAQKHKEKMYE